MEALVSKLHRRRELLLIIRVVLWVSVGGDVLGLAGCLKQLIGCQRLRNSFLLLFKVLSVSHQALLQLLLPMTQNPLPFVRGSLVHEIRFHGDLLVDHLHSLTQNVVHKRLLVVHGRDSVAVELLGI